MTLVLRRAIACRLRFRLTHVSAAFRVAIIPRAGEMVNVRVLIDLKRRSIRDNDTELAAPTQNRKSLVMTARRYAISYWTLRNFCVHLFVKRALQV
jgi:hypothetical protein